MLTITEMKAEIESIMTQIGAMRAQADSESREFTPDEEQKVESRLNRVSELEKKIENEQRLEDVRIRLEQAGKPLVKTDPPDPHTIEGRDFRIIQKEDRFPTLGDQLIATMHHARDGYTDPRLLQRAASGLNESVPSDGGWLVQQEFVNTILEKVYGVGDIAKLVTRTPIGAGKNGLKINAIDEDSRANGSRIGGVLGYWKCEAEEKVASKPKFRQLELDLKKLIGLVYATDELLDDAVALEGLIKRILPQELTFKFEDAVIWGTGAGMPLGIMNCGSMITVARAAGGNNIDFADILAMWARLYGPSRKNAVWLINQDIEPNLYGMCYTCGTYSSGPVYLPAGGISGSPYSTIFGRPVIPCEYCATSGISGDVILADFSEYLAIDKGGVEQAQSIHVRFLFDEQVFRFVYRVDGQCAWHKALTPFKGTSTQSPFVALQDA